MSIVVDSSAVTAVVLGEPDAESFADVMIRHAGDVYLGAPTRVECSIVVEARRGSTGTARLDSLLAHVGVRTVPLDEHGAALAFVAWRRFGKGRHPAGLNLGDCFSYAVAKSLAMPLLFKRQDFAQTDIASAG